MKINVLLNLGKKPSGALRPIIEFFNNLTKDHDIVIYKAYNPNKKGCEYFLREMIGFLLKGRKFTLNWMECKVPALIIPRYSEKWIRDADITFFRSSNLIGDVSNWSTGKGKKVMRVSNIHIFDSPIRIPENIVLVPSSTTVYEKLKILYPGHKIYRVGNGVNCEFFSPGNRTYDRPVSLGMVFYEGEHSQHKGVDIGFEVMKRIKGKFPYLRFFVAGLKKQRNIPAFVEFIDGLTSNGMLQFYRKTDIFLYPSLADAWPNPPMEAMACGCAVVTTDIGGVRDFAKDRETAIICTPGDIEELTMAVEHLITHPEFWVKLAKNGNIAIQKFDYTLQAKTLEKVFYEILSTG
ncbi:MAG TPA: glycosyltransferase family 4 protein [bacterium]|nr:glycosyltransferase family 4 protein [bacterium]